jgi:glutamate/tyrosine decarboxylase-like PLP-dependent enzyme
MQQMRSNDTDWRHGRTWSLVYFAGEKHHELIERAHMMFLAENALNPIAFKSLKKMEAEVVQMTASMLNAPDDAVGTMTTGGTESLLMAVKAARERGRSKTKRPEMVAPESIHPAVDKAAHYFGVTLKKAPLLADYRVDVRAMKKLVTDNTVLLLGSAPQYAHGVIDPIDEIGHFALAEGIPFHVDACIGGFVLPWVERLGYPIRAFDFRVPGVTSMSADLHKYGFAAKGASTVIYRDMSYLEHQFFLATDSPAGIYVSPSMTGTRAGGPIAAAWAALKGVGESGFIEHTRTAMIAAKKLQDGVRAIPELTVIGRPDATLVAWGSQDKTVDIYAVADQLEDRGWGVDRQQHPNCIHCTVTSNHLAVIDEYLSDIRAAVQYVKAHPEAKSRGGAAMYGMAAKIPFRGMVRQAVMQTMREMYGRDAANTDKKPTSPQGAMGAVLEKVGPTLDKILDRVDAIRGAFKSR